VLHTQGILVVDDDEFLAKIVSELLREKGYQVWTASDSLDAYSNYYQHHAGTILTDIDMPGLDGFEMMRSIRNFNPAARAIYMSGAPELYRRTLLAETENFAAAILRKPFHETELIKLLEALDGGKVNLKSHGYKWSYDQKKFIWREAN
jgi:two-component system NtrC family response regulator